MHGITSGLIAPGFRRLDYYLSHSSINVPPLRHEPGTGGGFLRPSPVIGDEIDAGVLAFLGASPINLGVEGMRGDGQFYSYRNTVDPAT